MKASLHHTAPELAIDTATIEVSRPYNAVSCNCRIPRDSSCASVFAALQQARLSLCMPEYGYTIPAKIKVLRRRNVQLKIRAKTSNGRDSSAHGSADPLQAWVKKSRPRPNDDRV